MATLLEMSERYDLLGRMDEVNRILRKAAEVDPLDERPRRALVRSLAQQGLVRLAIREYRAYRDMVRRELDAEPSAELRRLVANLGKRLSQDGGPR
jgi:DNA-binding SARP family transcriptional activator